MVVSRVSHEKRHMCDAANIIQFIEDTKRFEFQMDQSNKYKLIYIPHL